jgi:hypothetical protein
MRFGNMAAVCCKGLIKFFGKTEEHVRKIELTTKYQISGTRKCLVVMKSISADVE